MELWNFRRKGRDSCLLIDDNFPVGQQIGFLNDVSKKAEGTRDWARVPDPGLKPGFFHLNRLGF